MTFLSIFIFVVLIFWRPQEWLVPWLYGLPLLDAVFYMALLGLLVEIDGGKIRFPREAPQVYLIPGVWIAAMVSHVAHTYFAGLMFTIVPVFKICFFTFVLFCVLDRVSRLRKLVIAFVGMCCVMAVHAILQEKRGYGFAGQRPIWVLEHTRSIFFGIFEDPNDLAQTLATAIPLSFGLTYKRSLFSVLLGAGITWLLVVGVLATHSRGGIVALATVTAIMTVLVLPARWMPKILPLFIVAALLLCPLAGAYMDDSAHDRVAFWGEANRAFKTTPIFGLGYMMQTEYVGGDRAAHNAFVLCYSEVGLFGYWFWFGLILLGVVGAWRTRAEMRKRGLRGEVWLRRIAGLSIAAMGGFAASGYFLSRAYVYPMFFLMALLGALPVVARNYLPAGHPPLVTHSRKTYGMITVASMLSVLYIYWSIILLNKAYYSS